MFGREKPARKPRPGVEPARGGKETTASSKWKSHEQVLEEMLEAELDPSGRPRQKVRAPDCAAHIQWLYSGWLVPLQSLGAMRHIYCP